MDLVEASFTSRSSSRLARLPNSFSATSESDFSAIFFGSRRRFFGV